VYSLMPGTYAPPAVELPKTREIVGIPAADRRLMLRKLRPPGTKISAWRGRAAPPDSVRGVDGRRVRSAISIARPGPAPADGLIEPPLTVASFALITHSTPDTWPTPVMTRAPGCSPGSCAPA